MALILTFKYSLFIILNAIIKFSHHLVIASNDVTTEVSNPSSIPDPFEGFGEFHPPVDVEDIERNHEFDDRYDWVHQTTEDHRITNDHINITIDYNNNDNNNNDVKDNDSNYMFDNANNTRFRVGFGGEFLLQEEEGCYCRNDTHNRGETHSIDSVCRCFGESVTQIPNNLTLGLTRL